MWITLSEARFLGAVALTAPELAAARATLLPDGVTDRLTDALANVAREVRGYVGGWRGNALGEDATIPEELLGAAISRVTYEICRALPGRVVLTEQREMANKEAIDLLKMVARGQFAVVPPTAPAPGDEQSAGTGVEVVTSRERRATRETMQGL